MTYEVIDTETEAVRRTELVADATPSNAATVVFAAVLVVGLLGGAVAWYISQRPEPHTLMGTITLFEAVTPDEGSCHGDNGYDDIGPGAQVKVFDGDGSLIAKSELREGSSSTGSMCTFGFTVDDVPDADFYEVTVSHRDGLSFSRKEMEDNGWLVLLSLGDP